VHVGQRKNRISVYFVLKFKKLKLIEKTIHRYIIINVIIKERMKKLEWKQLFFVIGTKYSINIVTQPF